MPEHEKGLRKKHHDVMISGFYGFFKENVTKEKTRFGDDFIFGSHHHQIFISSEVILKSIKTEQKRQKKTTTKYHSKMRLDWTL